MSSNAPTPWQTTADEVLAVLLQDEKAHDRARFEWQVDERHFPPGAHREVFRAVDDLRLKNRPVHPAALHDACNGKVDVAWLGGLFMLYSEALTGEVFRTNVENMKARGQSFMDIQSMTWAIEALRGAATHEARQQVVADVLTALGNEAHATLLPATALESGERFEALMAAAPPKTLPTGIRWIDNLTGGMQHGQIWWIAAPYKMRKSSLMRNILINAVRGGASVTLAALEGSQSLVIAQLVAMFAAEWLLQHGHFHAVDKQGLPLNAISAALLLRLRQRYKTQLDPRQVAAVGYGIQEYKRLGDRLRIYDRTPENGGLGSLTSIETMLRRDVKKYGMDVCFIDYMQLIGAGRSSYFENVAHISQRLQQLAGSHNIAQVVLAQLNEEAVRTSVESHSPGVKGGGDPAATADFLFTTKYGERTDGDDSPPPDRMRITLKLARHASMGQWKEFTIHPSTGLLLPTEDLSENKTLDLDLKPY